MNSINYYFSGDKLYQDGCLLLTAPAPIESFLVDETFIIVLVGSSLDTKDRNVYCYGLNGNLLWQVDQPDEIHISNYFTSIYFSSNNELKAFSKNGVEYTLDNENGNILKSELIK